MRGKEQLLLGTVGVIIGGIIYFKANMLLPALVPFIIGIFFIGCTIKENKKKRIKK